MTILQFINSKLDEETPVGDFARDTIRDAEFKMRKSDKERTDYLEFAAGGRTGDIFQEFMDEFKASYHGDRK